MNDDLKFDQINLAVRGYYREVCMTQADCQKTIDLRHAQRNSTINDVGGLIAYVDTERFKYVPGNPFRYDTKGQSRDGLHRALACVLGKPGSTITVDIATGCTEDELSVIDLGSPRTVSDILQLNNVSGSAQEAKTLSSIGRALMLFDMQCAKPETNHHGAIRAAIAGTGSTVILRSDEVIWTTNHIEEIQRAAKYAVTSTLPTKVAGLMYAIFYRIDSMAADQFMGRVADGLALTGDSPIAVFRRRIEEDPGMDPKQKAAFLAKTWNAYRSNVPMERLLYRTAEKFNVEGYTTKPKDAVTPTFTSASTKAAIKRALTLTQKPEPTLTAIG